MENNPTWDTKLDRVIPDGKAAFAEIIHAVLDEAALPTAELERLGVDLWPAFRKAVTAALAENAEEHHKGLREWQEIRHGRKSV